MLRKFLTRVANRVIADATGTPDRRRREFVPRVRSKRAKGSGRSTIPTPAAAAGPLQISYDPHPDGRPDPGEIVWTWVPYEDDPSQGKDRPVLLIARGGEDLYGLMLSSKDHRRDLHQEERAGRFWYDLGSGPWDRQGRPSEVRINRLIVVDPDDVRREGAVLDKERFQQVVDAARPYLP